MDEDWILEKTAAGVDEVATRSRGLTQRQRALLIICDGRTPVGALCRTAAALGGEPRAALAELLALGLVRLPQAAPAAAARPQAGVPRPAAAPRQRRSLALARLYLMNAMEQILRRGDHPVRERLRLATSRAELVEAFAHCRAIADELGVGRTGAIEAQFMALLPEEASAEAAV